MSGPIAIKYHLHGQFHEVLNTSYSTLDNQERIGVFFPGNLSPGYIFLGHYSQGNNEPPTGTINVFYDDQDERDSDGNKMFMPPSGYNQIWNYGDNGSVWWPVAPPGYLTIGAVGHRRSEVCPRNDEDAYRNLRCVRRDLVESRPLGDAIWRFNSWLNPFGPQRGSGWHVLDHNNHPSGYFLAHQDGENKPAQSGLWFRKEFL